MLYSITLDFALPNNTPANRENLESEVQRFLQELETNPPQVTWEHLPQTSPQGWPEVRFVGSLCDIANIICQWNGGDADAIDEMIEFIEPVLDYAGHESCTGVDTSSDELLPGCCTCCAAAIERGDQIGHGPHLLRCPCLPVDECTPIVEGFSDPDGSPAARLLKDLPHLGLAAGSEWLLLGARR